MVGHIHCRVCKEKEQLRWSTEISEEMKKWNLCYSCNFWRKQFNDPAGAIIVKGEHYRIGERMPRDYPKHCKGFGGATWYIRVHPTDDKSAYYVKTDNLWCQGKVPDRWYDGDTASFISQESYLFNTQRQL